MDFDSLIIDAYKKVHYSQTGIDDIKDKLLDKIPNYMKVMLADMITSFNLKIVPFRAGPTIGEIADKDACILGRYNIMFSFYIETSGRIRCKGLIYDHILSTYVIRTGLITDFNEIYNKFLEFINE